VALEWDLVLRRALLWALEPECDVDLALEWELSDLTAEPASALVSDHSDAVLRLEANEWEAACDTDAAGKSNSVTGIDTSAVAREPATAESEHCASAAAAGESTDECVEWSAECVA
jgi:hypothetical protein